MFTIAELKSYVESVVPYTYYHNEFPSSAGDNAAYVRIFGGYAPSQWLPTRRPSFQIIVRNKSGPAAESKAYELYDAFHRRASYVIGTQRIVASFADQSAPLYLGLDENNRPTYSVNFTATLVDGQNI
ncbi:minor capsid protein [Paenibacillus sp. PAMC21692]|uniref:minor capsid protein n=1 Tax=Paenibacillus sp. PAMC21692 TaxID=2762320 RepID=UPI00164E4EF7|nr:minor capsid protein [Paenibacillus sp. PAMC21692]QNK54564.1 hypothetical protein H7F31_18055 [Paenibacillus sp. PAMC21692]